MAARRHLRALSGGQQRRPGGQALRPVWIAGGGLLVVLALLWAYAAWQRAQPAPDSPAVALVTAGMVEIGWDAEAVLSRRERLEVAPAAGYPLPLVPEGRRVRPGMAVVELVDDAAEARPPTGDGDDALAGRAGDLRDLREELYQLQRDLYAAAVALRQAREDGQSGRVSQLTAELERLGALEEETAARIYFLETGRPAGRRAPVAEGQDDPRVVFAPVPGVVSYAIDGLEGILDPDAADDWDLDWLEGLPAALAAPAAGPVAAGDPLFKVIDNLEMYCLLPLSLNDARRLTPGDTVLLRLTDQGGRELAAAVERISDQPRDGHTLVVLKVSEFPSELYAPRRLAVRLVLERHHGMLVPAAALFERRGVTGVYRMERDGPVFEPVQVKGKSGDLAAVDGLVPGDEILLAAPDALQP